MNGLKEDLSKLKGNLVFNTWKYTHKDSIFSYAFNTVEDERFGNWQFGFYDKDSNKVTSFIVEHETINMIGEDDVFKEEHHDVLEVNVDAVRMPILELFDHTIEFVSRKYPSDVVGKIVLVLQHIPKYGNIWNITLFTKSLNTINLKVDPSTGKVKSHNLVSMFEFRKS